MTRPRRSRRSVLGLSAALASTITLAATSTQLANAQPPTRPIGPRPTLRLESYEPSILDPAHTRDAASASLATEIFSGLTRIGVDLVVEPDIASGWDISEDGLHYSFHIRPNAIFHNQTPITAHAIKTSWERALDPSTRSVSAPTYLGNILGAEDVLDGRTKELSGLQVEDQATLHVTLTEPSKIFPAQLSNGPSLIIDYRDLVHGHAWWQDPNGSGPYKLSSWSEQTVLLERGRTSRWLGTGPQHVEIQQLDMGEGLLRYEQGDLDIAHIGGATVARFRDEREPRHTDLLSTPELGIVYLGFNVAVAPFDDVHVRRALAMTIDRRRINQVTLNGTGLEAHGMLPPSMTGHRPEFRGLSFDISAARAELARSSYHKADALPSITLVSPGRGVLAGGFTRAIVEPWKHHLGIEINVELWDFDDYIKSIENPRHAHQLFSSGWVADFPDPFNFLDVLFHSERPDNSFRLLDPTIDRLLARARTTPSEGDRLHAYAQVEDRVITNAVVVPITFLVNHALVQPWVRGYHGEPCIREWFTEISLAE
jgi:oligopeptide transport system substrate-binding protein